MAKKTELEKEISRNLGIQKRQAIAHNKRVRRLRNLGWILTPHPDHERSHWMVLLPPSGKEKSKEGREALSYYEQEKAKAASAGK
jgi:hypothetical protein